MLVVMDRAVLFVSIGWADHYDGTQLVRGNHQWLKENPDDCAEGAAFIPNHAGLYQCGIGRGRPEVESLDVVFVSIPPGRSGHVVVGVYYEARWEEDAGAEPPFCRALAPRVAYFDVSQRNIEVEWPKGQGMRRWAHRAGAPGVEHFGLYRKYLNVLQRRDPAA